MEDSTYTNLGLKQKPSLMPQGLRAESQDELSLANIIDEYSRDGWDNFTEKMLLKALSFEFKALLEIENLRDLVQDLIQIDHHLHLILDSAELTKKELGLEGFYQNLSTLFIRMALEEEVNADSMKRSIEIALEEEIYTWQERLQ